METDQEVQNIAAEVESLLSVQRPEDNQITEDSSLLKSPSDLISKELSSEEKLQDDVNKLADASNCNNVNEDINSSKIVESENPAENVQNASGVTDPSIVCETSSDFTLHLSELEQTSSENISTNSLSHDSKSLEKKNIPESGEKTQTEIDADATIGSNFDELKVDITSENLSKDEASEELSSILPDDDGDASEELSKVEELPKDEGDTEELGKSPIDDTVEEQQKDKSGVEPPKTDESEEAPKDKASTDASDSVKEPAPNVSFQDEAVDVASEVKDNENEEKKTESINKEPQPSSSIEYVDLDDDDSNHQTAEFLAINMDKEDLETENIGNTLIITEVNNDEENPLNLDKDENDKDNNRDEAMDEDPISDAFMSENQEGADEELCIIPDTERVISQAEKEAAISIPPLRDLSEATAASNDEMSIVISSVGSVASSKYIVSKCSMEELKKCVQCILQRKVKYTASKDDIIEYICHDTCLENFKTANPDNYILNWDGEIRVKDLTSTSSKVPPPKVAFERKCVVCKKKTDDDENSLTWEIMDFCSEQCLSKYQKEIGSLCANCNNEVRPNSLGKYCVRFGNDIRQFCSSHCLEEYKKGLKVCSYCQQDISSENDGFLAPIGDKGQFKDFCSQKCMEKYDVMTNNRLTKVAEGTKCSVCKTENTITIEYEGDAGSNHFCNERCFVAFSFVNNITPAKCSMCRRYYAQEILEKNTMFYDNVQFSFCSNSCQNIYIVAHRKIVPCVWCKVKKYNFDMIRRYFKTGQVLNMCSINCLSLFQVSINAVHSKKTGCNFCNKQHQPMYHLTMSDATIRNFCSYFCVMSFQNKFKKPITLSNSDDPVPAGEPKKNKKFSASDTASAPKATSPPLPVISSVQSLANNKNGTSTSVTTVRGTRSKTGAQNHNADTQVKIKHHIIIKPPPVPEQRNVNTMCRPRVHHKSTTIKPIMQDRGCQTDDIEPTKILIPVPIPIYIPAPLPMYSVPAPYPLPFPLPIPIPIFIPTTRNSAKGIMKEIKKIQVKIPTDPYEAELLMMAEMVAGDKKEEPTDSESDGDDTAAADDGGTFSPEPVDASNTFGDDMLQMALKMATELEEPAVDLEGALTASTITAPPGPDAASEESLEDSQPLIQLAERAGRGRKRGSRGAKQAAKRRRTSQPVEAPVIATQTAPATEPVEKPDAHLCLKYTFGVNAWKQWVTTKNTDMEKSSKFSKPFKTEILQLTSDELNFSLCLFVKEVRKPNGAEYAPDTIYYLCLGIQQYLFENGRIDNIFCDSYYEQFTDSLDEVARKFSVLYNDSHYIVTRVEEEHLWESKQLGAHSPHVLLSTLMFFNTKHFNLTSVQEHMQLSFSHIMKHWKRNPNQAGVPRVPGSRNVLLRFYPPQSTIQSNTRKKKVYEQQENDENPLRCPVKLYEFYLSKCPESVKTRNDVFYLLPERSCVPDSPVWYSTSALPQEALEKMLHRVKMVKEINVALLTS